jgi:ribosomal protein L7/L12
MSNHTLNALNTLQACLENRVLAITVVKFYLSKLPELALEAQGTAATITLTVPNRNGWSGGSYTYPVHQVKAWAAIARDNRFVEAIRQCRADTGLGLKDAKDLIEFIREVNTY